MQCDPVEKKPFFHVYPGALAYSFGMLGCDLHCSYCQNWVTSQALRDPDAARRRATRPRSRWSRTRSARARGSSSRPTTSRSSPRSGPSRFSRGARAAGSRPHSSPTATARRGSSNICGRISIVYKVDLKSFDDRHYRELGGRLQPILDTISWLHRAGVWVEIVTLLMPGFNDSEAELRGLTEFLAGVSPDIPWHVTAFHQDYRMTDAGEHDAGDAAARRGDRP